MGCEIKPIMDGRISGNCKGKQKISGIIKCKYMIKETTIIDEAVVFCNIKMIRGAIVRVVLLIIVTW